MNVLKESKRSVTFQLNEKAIEPENISKPSLIFNDAPIQQGRNELTLSRSKSNSSKPMPLRIEGIELFIDYKQ